MSFQSLRQHIAIGLALIVTVSAAFAETPAAAADDYQVRSAVRAGATLERSRKWLEAIDHYEAQVKKYPDNKELKYGLRRAKIHFGIDRRYADNSFEKKLLALPKTTALDRFDEVLAVVQSSYVDPMSSTSFVAHGTESLYLALNNQKFIDRHLQNVAPDRVRTFRKTLRDNYWNKPVTDRYDARRVVSGVCDIAWDECRLNAGPVVMEYLFGGCNALDDYSNYLTPDRLNDLYGNIEGEFVGLGIELKAVEGRGMHLVNVLPESPAEEGGLRRGDYIIEIAGQDCRRMTTDEAAKLLRGPSGSRVQLKIEDGLTSRERSGAFSRRAVVVKSIPVAKMIDRRYGVGYIQMTGFQTSTAEELDTAVAKLRREGMKSMIWDVRGNPGGLLTAAVKVLDRFINGGTLVSTKGRSTDQNWSYSARENGTSNLPLVLLVDGDSASASEIVAGAIRDHNRGTIVGRQTYGKWSVQSIFPLRGTAGMRLTTAKFYSPKGRTLGKVGVRPDIIVDSPKQHITAYNGRDDELMADNDIVKGLEVLRRQASR